MTIRHAVVGPIATNCYVVMDEKTKKAAVIDPGAEAARIMRIIGELGADVLYIMLTHGHFDHTGALAEVKKATGAKVICHKDDACRLSPPKAGPFTGFGSESIAVDIVVSGGETFMVGGIGAEYIHTPGHTEGSCIIKMEDALFTGDTLFRFECGRCDLEGGDFDKMLVSLRRIAGIPGQFRVYPGHEDFSTLDEERAGNPYIRMALEKA